MKNLILISIALALIFCLCSTNTNVSGTTDETLSGIEAKAMLYNPDGTKAIGALVKVFTPTDTLRTPVYITVTDTNGRYAVKTLASGTYNVWAEQDTLFAYQSSVFISPDTNYIKPDTLDLPGSITAIVGMQPNHDPRTVTVQVLGSEIYSGVDQNGLFALNNVAEGTYQIKLTTTEVGYSPSFYNVSAQSNTEDTLSDTLWLTYTGIPIVKGLMATYDTLRGIVTLSWNKTTYRDFQDYLVYRDLYNTVVLTTTPINFSADTIFTDTIFRQNSFYYTLSLNDTNDYRYKYRVAIRNNSQQSGLSYKYINVTAASPTKVKTTFSFAKPYHVKREFYSDSASINDTLRFTVRVENPNRSLRRIIWRDYEKNQVIKSVELDTTRNVGTDTVKYIWSGLGMKGLECTVVDYAGIEWKDTTNVSIITDAPIITLSTSTPTVSVNDTIALYANTGDRFGNIIKCEWLFGNTGTWQTSLPGSMIAIAPTAENRSYPISAKVTDDDGNITLGSMTVTVLQDAPVVTLSVVNSQVFVGDTIRLHANVVNNFGHIVKWEWDLGNTGIFGQSATLDTFAVVNEPTINYACSFRATDDDDNIVRQTFSKDVLIPLYSVKPFPSAQSRLSRTSLVFNNKIWNIGGWDFLQGLGQSDVWYSSNGSDWTNATPAGNFPGRGGHSSVIFDNKMWVIAGQDRDPWEGVIYSRNNVWCSSDGINWNQATNAAAFSRRVDHSSVVFDNKMWVIGGQDLFGNFLRDVWYSSNGTDWILATDTADFSARSDHSSAVFDNKIWVIGGKDSTKSMNDVWYSTDGVTWNLATSSAEFSTRSGHTSVVFDDMLWVIGGTWDITGWYSSDGVNWKVATNGSGSARANHTSVVYDNKIWVLGGVNQYRSVISQNFYFTKW